MHQCVSGLHSLVGADGIESVSIFQYFQMEMKSILQSAAGKRNFSGTLFLPTSEGIPPTIILHVL